MLVFYCGVGFYLIHKINTYIPNSDLERYLHENNKEGYKFDLKVCIATFLALFFVSNFYSIFLYVYVNNFSQYNSCTKLTNYWWLNQAIWVTDRLLQKILWIYPLIYVEWQKKEESKSNTLMKYQLKTMSERLDEAMYSSSSEEGDFTQETRIQFTSVESDQTPKEYNPVGQLVFKKPLTEIAGRLSIQSDKPDLDADLLQRLSITSLD